MKARPVPALFGAKPEHPLHLYATSIYLAAKAGKTPVGQFDDTLVPVEQLSSMWLSWIA